MIDRRSKIIKNYKLRLIILTLAVIIFLILMTSLLIKSNSNSSNNVPDFLTSLKDTSSSLILFLVSVSIFVAILMSFSILFLDEIRHPLILPFYTNDQNNLESKAITDAITANLMKIEDVLRESEKVLQTDQALLSIPKAKKMDIPGFSNFTSESSAVVNSLENAKLSAFGTELLITPLLSFMLQIRKLGDNGSIIRGSFQKFGEDCFAKSFVKTKKGTLACEVRGSYGNLPDLISDLAFEIVLNLVCV